MGEKRPEKETILKQCAEKTLRYFDVFSYPLLAEEVWAFCLDTPCSIPEMSAALQSMAAQGTITAYTHSTGNTQKVFYGIPHEAPTPGEWSPHALSVRVQQREEQNQRADTLLPLAYRMGRLIGNFPFVRGVFVSGSLSKHAMKPDSDIDFFIITHPGRLWITRSLLACFKKIFLFNSHKYFCINYFIDTQHLEIEDKNLFTAVETVTLLPVYGSAWYQAFCRQNTWAWRIFPNMAYRSTEKAPAHKRALPKRLLEYALSGGWATWLDRFLMRLTVRFWRRKFKNYDPLNFEQAFRSAAHISKHHPQHFQNQVLHALSVPTPKEI